MDKLIARLRKNSGEGLKVELNQFNGHQLFSLRVWTHPDDKRPDGVPTKKGVTLPIGMLPEVRRALEDAEREARQSGLIGDPDQAA